MTHQAAGDSGRSRDTSWLTGTHPHPKGASFLGSMSSFHHVTSLPLLFPETVERARCALCSPCTSSMTEIGSTNLVLQSPLYHGRGEFKLMLGDTCSEGDEDTGKWQGTNSPRGAWGRGLFAELRTCQEKVCLIRCPTPLPLHACVSLVCSDGTACSWWLLSGTLSGHTC